MRKLQDLCNLLNFFCERDLIRDVYIRREMTLSPVILQESSKETSKSKLKKKNKKKRKKRGTEERFRPFVSSVINCLSFRGRARVQEKEKEMLLRERESAKRSALKGRD